MTRYYRAESCDDPACTDERCEGGAWVEDESAEARLANQAYLVEVLEIFHEFSEDLWLWRERDHLGRMGFSLNCSDLFHWAAADSEPIEPADLPLLRQTVADLGAEGRIWASELFCARKRGIRPQGAFLARTLAGATPMIVGLFEAAGPPRDDVGLWNPVGRTGDSEVKPSLASADTNDDISKEPT